MLFHTLRKNYPDAPFDLKTACPTPIDQFKKWFKQAKAEPDIIEPNAMVLSTVIEDRPTSRTVLLKEITESGNLVFYTNYKSKKAREIAKNKNVALLFLWLPFARHIRIEGKAYKIKPELSDAYFKNRPRESQIGAWASDQSEELESRQELEEKFAYFKEKFKGQAISRPKNWGGISVRPKIFEFWQGRPNRLHDRLLYTKKGQNWGLKRLSP